VPIRELRLKTALPTGLAPATDTPAAIPAALDERRVIGLTVAGFAAYCLFVLVLKWFGFSATVFDHAKEVYHAQELRWVYDAANPPLYTWLLYGFQEVFGIRLATVIFLNTLLLFLIFLSSFVLARRVLGAVMPAALAAWSLMLVGQYHKFLYTMSHSLVAAIFCPLLLWLMVRIANERRLGDYIALGVVLGLGLLSKFLFLAAVVTAVIAAFFVRPARRGLLDLRSVVTIAIASAIFLPFVINGQQQWSRFTTVLWARAGTDQALDFFTSLGNGIWSLSTSIGEYGLAVAVVAGLAILWARQGPSGDAVAETSRSDELRFVGYMVLASAALVLAAILVVGVTIIKARFVHIFLFPLPILAVALVARGGSGALALRRYGVLLGLVSAGILAVRVVNSSPVCLNRCQDLVPFDRLAKGLSAAGFERGTIFAHGVRLGGNLFLQFPQSRVDVAVDPFVPAPPPAGRRGQCLIVWEQGHVGEGGLPMPLIEAAGIPPARARAAVRSITFDWRWHGIAVVDPIKGWRPRRTTWRYILLPDGTERCR
jgi:hypothetical protein